MVLLRLRLRLEEKLCLRKMVGKRLCSDTKFLSISRLCKGVISLGWILTWRIGFQ